MSAFAACIVYGAIGGMVVLYGVCLAPFINSLGVEACALIGTCICLTSRSVVLFLNTPLGFLLFGLTVYPMGLALTSPVLKIALRRFSEPDSCSYAVQVDYLIMNFASILASVVILASRGFPVSYLRLAIFTTVLASIIQLSIVIYLFARKTVPTTRAIPLIDYWTDLRSTLCASETHKYFLLSLSVALGVGSILRHFATTFPTYLLSVFGTGIRFEVLLAINPLVIIAVLPLVSWLQPFKYHAFESIMFGSIVSTLGVLFLGLYDALLICTLGMVAFTIGECFWSPRIIELSLTLLPEGKEGVMVAISGLPRFFSRLVVGLLSGVLTNSLIPSHTHILWIVIGVFGASTPLSLYILSRLDPSIRCPLPVKLDLDQLSTIDPDSIYEDTPLI